MKIKTILLAGVGLGVLGLLSYKGYQYYKNLTPSFDAINQGKRSVKVTWCGKTLAYTAGSGGGVLSCGLYELRISETPVDNARVKLGIQIVNRVTGKASVVQFNTPL